MSVSDHGAVLGGFVGLKVNDVAHDVLMLHSGLLLLADRERSADAKRLAALVAEVPAEELVRRHRLIPFADVTHSPAGPRHC